MPHLCAFCRQRPELHLWRVLSRFWLVCHGIADFLSVSVLAPRGIGTVDSSAGVVLNFIYFGPAPMVLSALVAIILGAAAWLARG